MTLVVLAWPHLGGRNPYTHLLYGAMQDLDGDVDVIVREFRLLTAWRARADIVHVHWPEIVVADPSVLRAVGKSVLLLLDLLALRVRGARIVWTAHNIHSHERAHPVLERVVRGTFERLVGGVVHLSEASRATLLAEAPRLRGIPHHVVPHGHYGPVVGDLPTQRDARVALGSPREGVVLAFAGTLRPHKGVDELVRLVAERRDDVHLHVAGAPDDQGLARRVQEAARGAATVHLDLRWLEDAELATVLRAADVVVLPYAEVHNSGVVVLAMTAGRRVAVRRSAPLEELAALVGEEWFHFLDAGLDPDGLDEVVAWARGPEPSSGPRLDALAWPTVARDTVAAYESTLAGRV